MKGVQHLSRRALLGFGPVALTSCISPQRHFGNTIPPQSQTLIYEISSEPSTFDPARMLGSGESSAMNALLECLVKANPETLGARSCPRDPLRSERLRYGICFLFARPSKTERYTTAGCRCVLPHLLVGAMARGSRPTILLWPGNAASIQTMHASTQFPFTHRRREEINSGKARPAEPSASAHKVT